jgi:hypothetical protein
MQILGEFRHAWAEHLIEVSYEELTSHPRRALGRLLDRLGEDPDRLDLGPRLVRPERNRYREVLSPAQIEHVLEACGPWLARYGYDRPVAVAGVSGNA